MPKGLYMSFAKKPSRKKTEGKFGAASLYMTVPTLMAAAILIGFFVGRWADSYFGTEPYLLLAGLALGFGAAVREVIFLVKRAQAIDEEEDKR